MDSSERVDPVTRPELEVSPNQPEMTLNGLPPEILDNVFSLLKDKDLQSAASVSRQWKEATIYQIERRENHKIRSEIQFLVDQWDEASFPLQKNQLEALLKTNPFLNTQNLKQLKLTRQEIRREVAHILADLPSTEIDRLEELNYGAGFSSAFNKVFDLAKAYKELGNPDAGATRRERNQWLQQNARLFSHNGDPEKALELISQITDDMLRQEAMNWIVIGLLQYLSVDRAVDLFKHIPVKRIHDSTARELALSLGQRGDFKSAESMLGHISDRNNRYGVQLRLHLMKGEFDKIVEVAKKIEDKWKVLHLLPAIFSLNSRGQKNLAKEITQLIPDSKVKDDMLNFLT